MTAILWTENKGLIAGRLVLEVYSIVSGPT